MAPTEADWCRSRQDPVLERWNAHMAQFLETDDTGGIVFKEFDKAFEFGDFS